jgi:hypothetical protein
MAMVPDKEETAQKDNQNQDQDVDPINKYMPERIGPYPYIQVGSNCPTAVKQVSSCTYDHKTQQSSKELLVNVLYFLQFSHIIV